MNKTRTSDRSSVHEGPVGAFLRHHYRHFNAATLIDAADAYVDHMDAGGAMMIIETFLRGQLPQSRAPPREDAA